MAGVIMYICPECGVLFEEPARYGEIHYELDDKAVEYFTCCPNCGETGFEEAVCCDYCGQDFLLETLIGGTLCPDCLDELLACRSDVTEAFIKENREAFAEFVHDYADLCPEVSTE